jgi:hypothetical protein
MRPDRFFGAPGEPQVAKLTALLAAMRESGFDPIWDIKREICMQRSTATCSCYSITSPARKSARVE